MSTAGSSSPEGSGWTDDAAPNTIQPFTTERVQSILDSRNSHPSSMLSLFYSDPAKTYRAVITKNLDSFQTQVLRNRPLTDDEVGALTDHWGTSANVALVGKPAAFAVALFLAWRGRGRFRFPFWQPKFAWHTGRLFSYTLLCSWVVTPLFLSYAGVRATVSISSDPRLQEAIKESVKDLKAQKTINHMQKRAGKAPTQFPPQEQGGQPGQSATGATGGGWEDDASPQSTRYQGNEAPRWGSSGADATGTSPQAPRTYGTPRPQQQTPSPPSSSERSGWGEDSILEELDDASPISPSSQAQDAPKRPQKQTRRPPPPSEDGVSAWDRVREQAQSEQNDDSKK